MVVGFRKFGARTRIGLAVHRPLEKLPAIPRPCRVDFFQERLDLQGLRMARTYFCMNDAYTENMKLSGFLGVRREWWLCTLMDFHA
jgi:hypothetical protein